MKLIKLNREHGGEIKVNPDNVLYMDKTTNGGAHLYFCNEIFAVTQSMDQIESLIQSADNL